MECALVCGSAHRTGTGSSTARWGIQSAFVRGKGCFTHEARYDLVTHLVWSSVRGRRKIATCARSAHGWAEPLSTDEDAAENQLADVVLVSLGVDVRYRAADVNRRPGRRVGVAVGTSNC